MKKKITFIFFILSLCQLINCGKVDNENQIAVENESENVNVNQTVDKNEREYSFFGTWYISKAVLTSELYTGTILDGVSEEDLYNPEDFVGFEIEYSKDFLRLGDSIYYNPIYYTTDTTVEEYNRGSRVQAPNVYQFIEEEGIVIENQTNYKSILEVPVIRFDVTFDGDIEYEKYDFIPVGTQCVLLNENTMLVGLWGKILLANRKM